MSIFVTQSSIASIEEYIEEIRPIFESKCLTNMGPIYKSLQKKLKEYLGIQEISLFVNGHMALEMAIQTMNFPKGSEIITTPYTFVSTTHAISRNDLVPVFCDIDINDLTMDVTKIEELITDKTVAILPVHVYGNVCDVDAINAIAEKNNLRVIYDAAHAFGVKYKGIGIGNFGDMNIFSFHATKVFNTIEGGAVTFKDKSYAIRLHELKNFGIHGEDDVQEIGANAKLDEFRAAMGICNLRHMKENISKRQAVTERYNERLADVPGIKVMKVRAGVEHNYAYYPILVEPETFGKSRDEVYDLLKENDIYPRKYFYPAVNDMDCYKNYNNQSTPVAREVSYKILTLPMYADLSFDAVDRICDIMLQS